MHRISELNAEFGDQLGFVTILLNAGGHQPVVWDDERKDHAYSPAARSFLAKLAKGNAPLRIETDDEPVESELSAEGDDGRTWKFRISAKQEIK